MSDAETTFPPLCMCVLVYACVRVCARVWACMRARTCRYINKSHSWRIYQYQTYTDSAAAVWILNVFPCWRSGNEVLMTVPAHRRGGGREGWWWSGSGGLWRCGWAVDARRIALRLTGDLVKDEAANDDGSPSLFAGGWRDNKNFCPESRRASSRTGHTNLFAPQMVVCSPAATDGFLFLCFFSLFFCRRRSKSPSKKL